MTLPEEMVARKLISGCEHVDCEHVYGCFSFFHRSKQARSFLFVARIFAVESRNRHEKKSFPTSQTGTTASWMDATTPGRPTQGNQDYGGSLGTRRDGATSLSSQTLVCSSSKKRTRSFPIIPSLTDTYPRPTYPNRCSSPARSSDSAPFLSFSSITPAH